jgi:hypothetical protein
LFVELSFRKINSRIVKLRSDEPPALINGKGIPMTGASPIVMAMFTIKWKNIIETTQYPYVRENGVF